MKKSLIPFGKPIVNDNEFKSVNKVLKSGKYVHGSRTLKFEKMFRGSGTCDRKVGKVWAEVSKNVCSTKK